MIFHCQEQLKLFQFELLAIERTVCFDAAHSRHKLLGLAHTVSTSLPVSQNHTPRSTPPPLRDAPAAPSKFRVSRLVGADALLLAWNAPHLDEQARSHGVPVSGYKVRTSPANVLLYHMHTGTANARI